MLQRLQWEFFKVIIFYWNNISHEILVGCYTMWPYFVLEHLGLALALNVPVFVVVTKIDMCPANVLQDTMKLLTRILKSPGCRKIPVIVQNPDDVVVSATNFVSERWVNSFFQFQFIYFARKKYTVNQYITKMIVKD